MLRTPKILGTNVGDLITPALQNVASSRQSFYIASLGPGYKSAHGDRLSWRRGFTSSLQASGYKFGHDSVLPCPLITRYSDVPLQTCITCVTDSVFKLTTRK